ncbi:hypothetical protein AAG906_023862 [Vitis piasezkii]
MCLPQGSWPYNETCRTLQDLVERLIRAGHLKQYLRSILGVGTFPSIPTPSPKAVINYINGGPSMRSMILNEKGEIVANGTIIFPPVDPTRTLQPHRDALILSLEIGDFDVRRILVDPGSSADLVQASVVNHMGHSLAALKTTANPIRVQRIINHILGRHYTAGPSGPPLSTYNSRWYKSYHPSMSFWQDASPRASHTHMTNSNYWVRGQRSPTADPLPTIQISKKILISRTSVPHDTRRNSSMQNVLRRNHDIFAWTHSDMKGIHPSIASHKLNIRRFHPDRQKVIRNEIDKLLEVDSSRSILSGLVGKRVVVPKKKENDEFV